MREASAEKSALDKPVALGLLVSGVFLLAVGAGMLVVIGALVFFPQSVDPPARTAFRQAVLSSESREQQIRALEALTEEHGEYYDIWINLALSLSFDCQHERAVAAVREGLMLREAGGTRLGLCADDEVVNHTRSASRVFRRAGYDEIADSLWPHPEVSQLYLDGSILWDSFDSARNTWLGD